MQTPFNSQLLRVFRKQLYKSVKLFLEDFYEETGKEIPKTTYYNWESGQSSPTAEDIQPIADFLDIDISDLYFSSLTPAQLKARVEYLNIVGREIHPNSAKEYGVLKRDAREDYQMFGTLNSAEATNLSFADFRNPDLFAFETDICMDIKNSTADAIVVSGPTRCGKTILLLEHIFDLHFKHENFQSRVVRAHTTDLPPLRKSIKDLLKYRLDDPLSPFEIRGGFHDFHTIIFPNGGQMILGGMNRPGKILGDETDVVFYNQAEQSTDEEWQTLETRVAGTAGNWIVDGEVRKQFLSDANPAGKKHHLIQRRDEGLVEWFEFGFDDNPLFNRKGKRTTVGTDVIDTLDRKLTGIWHDRYFKGLWTSPEGAVFIVPDNAIIDRLPDGLDLTRYMAMDFGMDHPTICLWIAEDNETGDTYVYREWRRTHTDIIQAGNEIKRWTGNEIILESVIDHDENRQKLLRNECDIDTVMARKGPGSVMDGIFLIQAALRHTEKSENGGLYIVKDLVCNTDPNPDIEGQPQSLIDEMETLEFDGENDKPVKIGDDAVDSLRYHYLSRAEGVDWVLDDLGSITIDGDQ